MIASTIKDFTLRVIFENCAIIARAVRRVQFGTIFKYHE